MWECDSGWENAILWSLLSRCCAHAEDGTKYAAGSQLFTPVRSEVGRRYGTVRAEKGVHGSVYHEGSFGGHIPSTFTRFLSYECRQG